ncbi:MAG: 4-alpha-glucanotransferase, partial [Alphaproteobacteria bacterium]|nr:4-alpha-glucanotransferase [Alphaproteobacteria bacterium]
AFVCRTPCPLAIVPAEDILGLIEQPNIPGTINEHPNWRRRLPSPDVFSQNERRIWALRRS